MLLSNSTSSKGILILVLKLALCDSEMVKALPFIARVASGSLWRRDSKRTLTEHDRFQPCATQTLHTFQSHLNNGWFYDCPILNKAHTNVRLSCECDEPCTDNTRRNASLNIKGTTLTAYLEYMYIPSS